MSTPAQCPPNGAESHPVIELPSQTSTRGGGPRTESGKAASSRNATTHGLYTTRDFVRTAENPAFDELTASLHTSLVPEGPLELNLVHEIRSTIWRLRRCGQIEENFAASEPEDTETLTPDPMQQESTARLQLAIDRARAQSHRLLHKCTAELRKLQTERLYRHELFDTGVDISYLGIADVYFIRKSLDVHAMDKSRCQKAAAQAELAELKTALDAPPPNPQQSASRQSSAAKNSTEAANPKTSGETTGNEASKQETSSFCNEQPCSQPASFQTPRNAECPCGSGLKHKRCCGKNAPAVLHAA